MRRDTEGVSLKVKREHSFFFFFFFFFFSLFPSCSLIIGFRHNTTLSIWYTQGYFGCLYHTGSVLLIGQKTQKPFLSFALDRRDSDSENEEITESGRHGPISG